MEDKVINLSTKKERKYVDIYLKKTKDEYEEQPELTEANIKILLDDMDIKIQYNEVSKTTITDTKLLKRQKNDETYEQIVLSMVEDELMRDDFKSRRYDILCRKLDVIAFRGKYNPIRDYLKKNYDENKFKIKDSNEFDNFFSAFKIKHNVKTSKMLFKKWFVSCIAAQMEEQFESHGILTFTGGQGIGKTSSIKKIIPKELDEYFKTSFFLDVSNKDKLIEYIRNWIVELGELGSMLKKDMDKLKSFITSGTDTIRNPYGRKAATTSRRTVAYATVDTLEFLKDDENRRFWVIEVNDVDLKYINNIDFNLLWAEIFDMYKRGEKWYLSKPEIKILNEHNMQYRLKNETESFLYSAFDWESKERYYIDVSSIYTIMKDHYRNITFSKIGKALSRMDISYIERRGRKRFYKMPNLSIDYTSDNNWINRFDKVEQERNSPEPSFPDSSERNKISDNNISQSEINVKSDIKTFNAGNAITGEVRTIKASLDETNRNKILGVIFLQDDLTIFIPKFTNDEVYQQALNNLWDHKNKKQIYFEGEKWDPIKARNIKLKTEDKYND